MDKLSHGSPAPSNLDRLLEAFPVVATETFDDEGRVSRGVNFDLLRQELSGMIVEGPTERYQLDWPGKRAAALAGNRPSSSALRPERGKSVDFDRTQNLFIEGDNLDALKLLQTSYLGRVKLVYVDPPYNTGNDFVYEDDFAESSDEYLERTGQTRVEGERLVANPETNGRFHSDWLSMMYPRLKLARNLLKDDGVILVSIDDNEVHNLRALCNEVFGSRNFVAQMVWQRSKKGDSQLVARVHEYILCYARDRVSLTASGPWRKEKEGVGAVLAQYEEFRTARDGDHELIRGDMQAWYRALPKDDPRRAHAHYSWSDDRGLYFADNFAGPDDGRAKRPRHDIIHPVTGLPTKKPSTGWRWDEARTRSALEEVPPRIHFGPDHTTIPMRKSYLNEITTEPFSSVFYRDGRAATLEVEKLVGKGVFPFPKNTEVLADLIELTTRPGDIVLDFFAGSASTGHAVFRANERSSTNRRFVLVQLAEATGRADYADIAEVARERLRQAGEQFRSRQVTADVGFRSLRIDSGARNETYVSPDDLVQASLEGFASSLKDDRSGDDLLFQVMTDWGLDLSLPISTTDIDGHVVMDVDSGSLVACFDLDVTPDVVTAMAQRRPLRAVFRDSAFADDAARINADQIFAEISPEADVKAI